MRRALASLLLAVIGLPLITPWMLADSRPELPTCCRRDGKHHCGMQIVSGDQVSSAPSITSLHTKCPLFPKPGVLPANSKTAVVAIRSLVAPFDSVQFVINRSTFSRPLISNRGAERKRGPPPVFS